MKKNINLITEIISSTVGLVGVIFNMAIQKENQFGRDVNKFFTGLITITMIMGSLYYTFQIQSFTTRLIVFSIEFLIGTLLFMLFVAPKLNEKNFTRDYGWMLRK